MARFDDQSFNRRNIPNVDYICTVEADGNLACYKEYPMPELRGVEIELEAVAIDDSKSLLDLQKLAESLLPKKRDFLTSFLSPRSYLSAYVEEVKRPALLTKEDFQKKLDKMAEQLDSFEGPYVIEVRNRRFDEPPIQRVVPKEVYKSYYLKNWNLRIKKAYLELYSRYIHSVAYKTTLDEAKVTERLGKEVKMYSTDNIGWTTYTYKINEDVTIQFDSNFGYGMSSYFHLGLFYKGIEIFPYSSYVRYRYANVRELLRHTFSYRQERESWSAALRYVVICANRAITSPDEFVGEFIWGEIEKMLKGLSEICDAKEFNDCLNPENAEEVQYLGVRASRKDEQMAAVLPNEMLMMLKSEKVVGALVILEKLKSLPIITDRVAAAIADVIFKLKKILPELENTINAATKDLREKEQRLPQLKVEQSDVAEKISRHEECVKALVDAEVGKVGEDDEDSDLEIRAAMDAVHNKYDVEHPEYQELVALKKKLAEEEEFLNDAIPGRRMFLEELQKCYGVGMSGEKFIVVVDKLMPHMKVIRKRVDERMERADATRRSSVLADKIEQEEMEKYITEHRDLEQLFEVRKEVLAGVDGFKYSNTEDDTRRRRNARFHRSN